MELANIATIRQIQMLADERNWIILQRDKAIADYELKPHEPLYKWWMNYSFGKIDEIDACIAKLHKQIHREHQSVLEALGIQ